MSKNFKYGKKETNVQQWFFVVSAAAHTCASVHFAFLLFCHINLTIQYNRLAQNNLGTNTGIARFGIYSDLKRRCKWRSDADSHARLVVCFCSFSIINMNQLTFLRCHSVTQNMFTKWKMRSDTRKKKSKNISTFCYRCMCGSERFIIIKQVLIQSSFRGWFSAQIILDRDFSGNIFDEKKNGGSYKPKENGTNCFNRIGSVSSLTQNILVSANMQSSIRQHRLAKPVPLPSMNNKKLKCNYLAIIALPPILRNRTSISYRTQTRSYGSHETNEKIVCK